MKIPNVAVPAGSVVPADFAAHAKRLGWEPHILLWQLAEDLCARPVRELRIVKVPPALPKKGPRRHLFQTHGEDA